MNTRTKWFIILGVFLVTLCWFSYTLYWFMLGITSQTIIFTDMPATVGLGLRTAAGFIAVITVLFHLVKRNLSTPETMISVRWVVLLEALYFLMFIPSAIWGLGTTIPGYPSELLLVSTGLPCLVEAIIIPIVLIRLFIELSPKKPAKGFIKWGLISGIAYIFVFWLNYTMQWAAALIQKGMEFVTLYAINAFGFTLTALGLFLLAGYAAVSFKKMFGKETLAGADLKKIGGTIMMLGLYFDLTFVLWLMVGSVGGYNMWHTFFIFHNVDLWVLALPIAGLPVFFNDKF